MSVWDDFTNILKGAASGITGGIAGAISGGAKAALPAIEHAVAPVASAIGKQVAKTASGVMQGFGAAGYTPGAGPSSVVAKAGVSIAAPQINQLTGGKLTTQAQASMADVVTNQTTAKFNQFDPMLAVGTQLENKVYSPVIKRPIAAAALLTDPTSPLYDAGTYGAGFQPSDLQAAYGRTKDVSLGIALTKSYLNPFHVTGISDAILANGGVNVDKVNLWDDKDIKKNFTDNTTGRYMSGLTDAVIGNVAIQAATSGSLSLLKMASAQAGLTTALKMEDVNSIIKFEKNVTDHLDYVNTNGASGQRTVLGSDIERLAKSNDVNEIADILEPHSNNPRLINIVKNTQDPAVVRDFILADKGYAPALQRIANLNMSDDLWVMSNAGAELQADFINTGKLRSFSFEQRQRMSKAFDDAIAKNPKHQELYDAFLRDEAVTGPVTPEQAARGIQPGMIDPVPRSFGKAYQPMEPILGKGAFSKVRTRASELRTAAVTRDFSNVGGVAQRVIGRKDAATAMIKFVSTKMPRGVVTNSGIRPMDAIEEINAHFDSIKAFSNGSNRIRITPEETQSASEYRQNFMTQYLSAQTDAERGMVLDNLNAKLVYDVARTHGALQKDVQSFVEEAMGNINKYHSDLAGEAYAMDPSGIRIKVDPETQRQLRNATPLLPVASIEKDILVARKNAGLKAVNKAGEFTNFAYEFGNKSFSFTQLVRPSYIGKNSVIEPLLVSVLSHGSQVISDGFMSGMKNAILNNKNRVLRGIDKSNALKAPAKIALKNDFEMLTKEYGNAVELLENHIAEYNDFFTNPAGRSPATRIESGDIVKRDLNAAEKFLRNIEERMNDAAPEFTAKIKSQPTLYNLTRRVQYLKSLKNPAYAADIANAEAAIVIASGDINTLAPQLAEIDKMIANEYARLETKIQGFGELHKKKADLYFVSEDRSVQYGTQKPFTAVMPNGEKIDGIPQFGSKNHLGSGYQSEVANTHTRQIELTGDKIFGQKVNMFNRRGPAEITDISSPHYFDELAYVANHYMKGDILIDQILAGKSRDELLAWGKTRQASSYAAEFGKSSEDIVSIIDNQIAYINRYLPSAEAQALLAKGEVNGAGLAKLLADNPQDLTPIHPLDVSYSIKTSSKENFNETLNRLTSAAWVKLATPENKFRYAWASTEYKTRVTDKLAALQAQGYEINTSTINGIRQASAAEVVQELEKTFYSIRRANRALFTARTVLAFPTASASGIYRYARLAVKNPGRFGGFLNSYYGLYNSFGVDKYGNPTDNPMDAEYFIVPGTKEMGLNGGKGIMLSARATNFAVNFAGPSYLVPIALGQIYRWSPLKSDSVKSAWDKLPIAKISGYKYDELFPFGVETDLTKAATKTVTPGWMPALQKYLGKNGDGSVDWTNSVISEFEYQGALYDMNLGPAPTTASVVAAAKKNFGIKFLWQFGSIIGSPAYVETKPMGVFQDFFNAKANAYAAQVDKNGDKVYTRVQAAALAEQDLNTMLRLPKGTNFPVDRLNQKAYSKSVYIPNSQEAVSRIWDKHSALAKKLESLDKGGGLVGLMTADLPVGTNPQVGKMLSDPNATLPGGDFINNPVKSVEQLQTRLEVSRYWKAYVDLKNTYDKAAKDAGYASYRSVPKLVEMLHGYAETLGKASPAWNANYKKSVSGDNAVTQAIGMQTILNNRSYMDEYGNTQFWVHAKAFMSYRDSYAKLYADAPTGYKGAVQDAWVKYLDQTRNDWDPALMNIIDRYFVNDKLKETGVPVIKPKEKK